MNACITGASAGIGKSTAFQLAKLGYNLVITGRRKEKLNAIKAEIEDCYDVSVFVSVFDIQQNDEVINAVKEFPKLFKQIDVLVNNAGLAAGLDSIDQGNLEHWERMINTNVKGLLYMTKAVLPYMIEQQAGHIVNIGSIAGKEVYANGNVYCATKHAVDALSKSMRLDLTKHGIKITNIAPGLVETEFSLVRFDQDEAKAKQVYHGFEALSANDIAECICFAVSRPKHVTIGDMLILPAAQANSTTVIRNV